MNFKKTNNEHIGIVSGYFNPIHLGHIRMIQDAKSRCDFLVVIVNNDKQQLIKKGKIIMEELERFEIVKALGDVDEVILSVDEDKSVVKTLRKIGQKYQGKNISFYNGGDRQNADQIPEAVPCKEFGIDIVFGVGGNEKINSSTHIFNQISN